MKEIITTRNISYFFILIGVTVFLTILTLSNIAPFGISVSFASDKDIKDITMLEPPQRVKEIENNGQKTFKQIDDIIYFSTKMPFQFDTATVTITLQNPTDNQDIFLGFKDSNIWHYSTQLIDSPTLNKLLWNKVADGKSTLYQRENHYNSIEEFQKNLPQDAIIGTYATELNNSFNIIAPHAANQNAETIINTPLRGKQTFYMYVENEPFILTIKKQDLNWYTGPDSLTITVYKDTTLVYKTTISDDGITDNRARAFPPQIINIKNPGPGLPQNGIYKVVIDANNDTVINEIRTPIKKIVFQGPVYPVANNKIYPKISSQTTPTILYTNAPIISAVTYHNLATQSVQLANQVIQLKNINEQREALATSSAISTITIPKSDVVIDGILGYFSFDINQFFIPQKYLIIPITQPYQVQGVDYILADYMQPRQEGAWTVAQATFDLKSANIKDGMLSWSIQSPGLKKYGESIFIKNIRVTFFKKGFIK